MKTKTVANALITVLSIIVTTLSLVAIINPAQAGERTTDRLFTEFLADSPETKEEEQEHIVIIDPVLLNCPYSQPGEWCDQAPRGDSAVSQAAPVAKLAIVPFDPKVASPVDE